MIVIAGFHRKASFFDVDIAIMIPHEISSLCIKLRLDEEDGPPIMVSQNSVSDGFHKMELCLVGNIMGTKLVNKEGRDAADLENKLQISS